MAPFSFDVVAYFDDHANAVREDLTFYFERSTGRRFEHWIAVGDPARFELSDVAACAALSVPLSGDAVAALVLDHNERLAETLAAVPAPSVPLWEVDPAELSTGPLVSLYRQLRGLPDIGYVRATKLMAAKRPHCVPIRDTVVEQLLGLGAKDNDWLAWHALMSDGSFRAVVEGVSADVIPAHTSLLRRVDVALWSAGKRLGLGGVGPRAAA